MILIEDAKAAKEAGMNYGVWKSLQPRVPYKKMGTETKVCPNCRRELPPGNRRFCSRQCRTELAAKNKNGGTLL